jgi:hypothetical protein
MDSLEIHKIFLVNEHSKYFALPNAVEDKKELNKDASKRQHSTHEHSWYWLSVEVLLGDLTRNLVGAHWVLNSLHQSQLHMYSNTCTNNTNNTSVK